MTRDTADLVLKGAVYSLSGAIEVLISSFSAAAPDVGTVMFFSLDLAVGECVYFFSSNLCCCD